MQYIMHARLARRQRTAPRPTNGVTERGQADTGLFGAQAKSAASAIACPTGGFRVQGVGWQTTIL